LGGVCQAGEVAEGVSREEREGKKTAKKKGGRAEHAERGIAAERQNLVGTGMRATGLFRFAESFDQRLRALISFAVFA
jgi:hypothetical protein